MELNDSNVCGTSCSTNETDNIKDQKKRFKEYSTLKSDSQNSYLANYTFYCLSQDVLIRRICICLLKSPLFSKITIAVILANCIMMTFYNYCEEQGNCESLKCSLFVFMDHIIFAYFALEMVVKMIAMGCFGKQSYFMSTWNKLDSFIVSIGALDYIVLHCMGDISNVQHVFLRVLRILKRILRPLRAINRVTSMRVLAGLVIKTVPLLANVLLLCFLVFFIFGLIAVQLWAGIWRNRCTTIDPLVLNVTSQMGVKPVYENFGSTPYICSLPSSDGMNTCHDMSLRNTTMEGNSCGLSLDDAINWTNSGIPIESPSNCINWNYYYNTCMTLDTNPFMGVLNFDNIFYSWITIFVVISQAGWTNIMDLVQDSSSFWTWIYFVLLNIIGSTFTLNLFMVVITTQFSAEEARRLTKEAFAKERSSATADGDSDEDSVASYENQEEIESSFYAAIIHSVTMIARKCHLHLMKLYDNEEYRRVVMERKQLHECQKMIRKLKIHPETKESLAQTFKLKRLIYKKLDEIRIKGKGGFPKFQYQVYDIVISPQFNKLVLIGISINSIFMALDAYNQPIWIAQVFELFNYVFTALFAVEMILKLIGLGPYYYIKDPLNLADGTIVITSIVELFQSGRRGLGVLRAFRLLRLVKLIRFMPALLELFHILARTMNDLTVFLALLTLVIFIFSLSGMILFGGRLCVKEGSNGPCSCNDFANASITCLCDRSNFDTFLNSSLTVFQIITTEGWSGILVSTMARVNAISSVIYFVMLFFVGNYIMMNLVVAIMVQGCMERTVEKLRKAQAIRRTSNRTANNKTKFEGTSLLDDDHISRTDSEPLNAIQRNVAVTVSESFNCEKSKFKKHYMRQHQENLAKEQEELRENFNSEAAKLHTLLFHKDKLAINKELDLPNMGKNHNYKELWEILLKKPGAATNKVCREKDKGQVIWGATEQHDIH